MYYNPYQQRRSFGDGIKSFFCSGGSVLSWLLIVNVGVWVCVCVVFLVVWLYNQMPIADVIQFIKPLINNYLAVPFDISRLLVRFWTPFSYMFLHFDFWHIFINMLWLYWFGRIFLEFLSSRKLLTVYLWGGIFGALFFILSYNTFPVFEDSLNIPVVGASASVMAIVAAISFYVPRYTLNLFIFGRVRLIWIALIYLAIDLYLIPYDNNAGGHITHLGGALFGFLYAVNLKKSFFTLRPFKRNLFKKKAKKDASYRYTNDELYNIRKKQEQEEIDRILDKISKHGYEVLSKKEKDALFKKSH
jgi:membrane associated rhomboid family serine protease